MAQLHHREEAGLCVPDVGIGVDDVHEARGERGDGGLEAGE